MLKYLKFRLFVLFLILLTNVASYAQQQQPRPYVGLVISQEKEGYSTGTCVLIDDDLALTNHHVISEATKVSIVFGGRHTRDGVVLKSDPDFDLALIKISGKPIPGAHRIGMIDDEDYVTTCGFKQGVVYMEVTGELRSLVRPPVTEDGAPAMFVYRGKVYPGMSGGPMVGKHGYLVGIVWGSHKNEMYGIRMPSILQFLEGTEYQPRVFDKSLW
jgi:S1-C subfamily serine protease